MKKLFGLILFLSSACAFSGIINNQCPQFTVNSTPQYHQDVGDQEICHLNFAVIYQCKVKAPIAVFEHVTIASITGPARRKDNFHPDKLVSPQCSASLADYASVGKTHDKGHMSPAGNNTQSEEIMSESFNLSNMVPQVANNNRGSWKLLEEAERQWALAPGTDFYIISGGIFDPGHPVIGNGLGIPTRLYKIIIEKNSKKVQAYLFPNAPIKPATDWPKYQVSMTAIEQATHMRFGLGQ